MAKIHPVRTSQFMKTIRDIHFSFKNWTEVKYNQPISPHTAILERVCAILKISENTDRMTLTEYETCSSPGKQLHSFQQQELI